VVVSTVPKHIKELYPEIEIYDLISKEKVNTLLSKTDIFLYPSLIDTFGFSILEAISFGIPVVALETNLTHSIREIINEKIGLVLKTKCTVDDQSKELIDETSEELSTRINILMKDKKLMNKMSKECIKEITLGKFSVKQRNKKLKRIYEEAIK
jgi:glycosyltransferase involved in cell wall biosynthesis